MDVRRVARTAGATCLGTAATVGVALALCGAPVAAQTCTNEVHQWSGQASLAPGGSYGTGVVVPSEPGTTLQVTGVSADALDSAGIASSLAVSIGGASAAVGATVGGGEMVLHSTSPSATLTAYGAAVTVERCTTVAQEAPVPSQQSRPDRSQPRSTGTTTTTSSGELPSAGVSVAPLLLAALALSGTGVAACGLARRRA